MQRIDELDVTFDGTSPSVLDRNQFLGQSMLLMRQSSSNNDNDNDGNDNNDDDEKKESSSTLLTSIVQPPTTTTTTTTLESPSVQSISKAGILPYSIAPSTGDVFFLLGREAGTSDVYERKTWCGFEGKLDPGEVVERAAAREFVEETMATVCVGRCTEHCTTINHCTERSTSGSCDVRVHANEFVDQVERMIVAGEYARKVLLCVNYGANPDVPRRYHATYVMQIPFQPHIQHDFDRLYERLSGLARRANEVRLRIANILSSSSSTSPCFTSIPIVVETTPNESVDEPMMLNDDSNDASNPDDTLMDDRPACCPLPSRTISKKDLLPFLEENGTLDDDDDNDDEDLWRVARLTDIQVQSNRWSAMAHLTRSNDRHRSVRLAHARSDEAYVNLLLAIDSTYRYYDSMAECARTHPSVFCNQTDGLPDVHLCFLEKFSIQYWSVRRLHEVLESGGSFRREYFRCAFLPTLAVVLDSFQHCRPNVDMDTMYYKIFCSPRTSHHIIHTTTTTIPTTATTAIATTATTTLPSMEIPK